MGKAHLRPVFLSLPFGAAPNQDDALFHIWNLRVFPSNGARSGFIRKVDAQTDFAHGRAGGIAEEFSGCGLLVLVQITENARAQQVRTMHAAQPAIGSIGMEDASVRSRMRASSDMASSLKYRIGSGSIETWIHRCLNGMDENS